MDSVGFFHHQILDIIKTETKIEPYVGGGVAIKPGKPTSAEHVDFFT